MLKEFIVQKVQEEQEIDGTCQKEEVDIVKSFEERYRENIQSAKDSESEHLEKLFKEEQERIKYLEEVLFNQRRVISYIKSSEENLEQQKANPDDVNAIKAVKKIEDNLKRAKEVLIVINNLINALKNEEEITIITDLIKTLKDEKGMMKVVEKMHYTEQSI